MAAEPECCYDWWWGVNEVQCSAVEQIATMLFGAVGKRMTDNVQYRYVA